MPISDEHELILVHVPKNAGTSVQEAFGMDKMQGHHTASDYRRRAPKAWEEYTSIGIVRNPFDRAVSAYEYAVQEESYWHDANNPAQAVHGKHPDYDELKDKPFSYAIRNLKSLDHHGWHRQVRYVCEDGSVAVDHVVKMESLDSGLESVCEYLGIEYPGVPTINQSREDGRWDEYYDETLASKVVDFYREDFETFGYSKTLP